MTTTFAGVFYLLNPLRRLGLGADEPGAIWATVAEAARLLVPTVVDDPIDELLAGLGAEADPTDTSTRTAEAVALLDDLGRTAGLDRPTLAELVAVTGTILLSETHLDVELPLDAIDLTARRHGLDTDPGWYAEAGLVIRFHFGTRR